MKGIKGFVKWRLVVNSNGTAVAVKSDAPQSDPDSQHLQFKMT